jgi:hypothetical protein
MWISGVNSIYQSDSFWQDVTNKKWLFEAYAKREGFDPNVASNWYSCSKELFVHKVSTKVNIPFSRLTTLKSIQGILQLYSGNIANALADVFSHIRFEKHKFPNIPGKTISTTTFRNSEFLTSC